MTRSETDAGTPVLEMSAEEHERFLDEEARRRLGVSVAEFRRRYRTGELDDSDPDVALLAVLTAVGQNSDQAPA
jgi:hypothetical protein